MVAKLMKHDKTLYQNNTLEDLKNDNSKAKVNELLTDASKKDRASSATKRHRDSQQSIQDKDDAATNASFLNLERVFDELDALNSTDNCLATRIQILEKALKANHTVVKQHTVDINELKNV